MRERGRGRGGVEQRPSNLAILYFKEDRGSTRTPLYPCRTGVITNRLPFCEKGEREGGNSYTRCSFTMDKSESIMIRTRQKWRRHQHRRRAHTCGPPSSRLLCSPNLPSPVGIEAKRVERSG